jgi:hypothetical protein
LVAAAIGIGSCCGREISSIMLVEGVIKDGFMLKTRKIHRRVTPTATKKKISHMLQEIIRRLQHKRLVAILASMTYIIISTRFLSVYAHSF